MEQPPAAAAIAALLLLLLLPLVVLVLLVLLSEWPHERAAVATNSSCARAAQSGKLCVVSMRGHTEQKSLVAAIAAFPGEYAVSVADVTLMIELRTC
jgi:hypothetical protein